MHQIYWWKQETTWLLQPYSTSQANSNFDSNKCAEIYGSSNTTGRTIIVTDNYNCIGSDLEDNKNPSIRKTITGVGDKEELITGTGYHASFIAMQEGSDIDVSTPNNSTSQSVITLRCIMCTITQWKFEFRR